MVLAFLKKNFFKVVATCGLDSYIIVWDPWTGKRMNVIKEAHTRYTIVVIVVMNQDSAMQHGTMQSTGKVNNLC